MKTHRKAVVIRSFALCFLGLSACRSIGTPGPTTERSFASLMMPAGMASIIPSRLTSIRLSSLIISCCWARNSATTSPNNPPSPKSSHAFLLLFLPVVRLLSLETGTSRTSSPGSGVPSRDGDGDGESLKIFPTRRRSSDMTPTCWKVMPDRDGTSRSQVSWLEGLYELVAAMTRTPY